LGYFFSIKAQQLPVRTYDETRCALMLDSLRENFGRNKKDVPKEFETSVLVALSFYPELVNSKITFKYLKISTSMNARPTLGSLLFRRKAQFRYVVRINNSKKDSTLHVKDVPFNAQIGLFGHEFFHFVDYRNKQSFHITKRLLAYTNDLKKEKFEKEIDLGTISRGLGWQLYDWSNYVLHESNATKEYKDFKRLIYMEPEEIEKAIVDLYE
jgi:hypothetical protein